MTTRGVIAEAASTDLNRNRLRMIFDSRSLMWPCSSPSPAIATNSSRLKFTGLWLPAIQRVRAWDTTMSGYIARTSRLMKRALGTLSWRQYTAPRVLGTISEPNRISRVMTAENTPNQASPNTIVAWAPAPMAPTVWAMVLRVRMAASDRSRSSSRSFFSSAALAGWRSRRPAM